MKNKKQLSRAALPLVALFGGNACASSRNPLSMQNSMKKSSAASVVYLQNIERVDIPALTSAEQSRSAKSPFAAFTQKRTTGHHSAIDRQSQLTSAVLGNQDLLKSQRVASSSVSGNTIGRKNFSDNWIASTRLATTGANTISTGASGATYAAQALDSFFASRQGISSIFCSLYGNGTSTITSSLVSMTMSNQGGRCRDLHMACDQQPLPVELIEFKID